MKKQNINYDNRKFLYEAILQLKNMEECEAFFEDLCTVQELASISQRLVVAKLLTEDKVYSDIVEKTSASTATISRVNRTLQYGRDGYNVVFNRLKEVNKL
ncbi:MAG: YerC/YecD family TrpR-related protein [Ruminiclostridium sp.]